ncbi:hypothetical protein CC1G_15634 [Coprinopsis cinerea okayama7|uniref:Dienelactone hydrolase domain-containing protein n=1 Tax=Coprinopsis cinerea (strain Okayama-7 / 130 / ATCC MYA-4618 / FGSC 9003) TaxID=240176 RepID=D6RN85_COPC7|nr:hypothetical protein CC1G_15634 [Coprinopsis cinerea okayama7\|eukprot:XP_002911092.1 hypothetical protein CC1G_15634 [Coprinopsis cinerea okayama7\
MARIRISTLLVAFLAFPLSTFAVPTAPHVARQDEGAVESAPAELPFPSVVPAEILAVEPIPTSEPLPEPTTEALSTDTPEVIPEPSLEEAAAELEAAQPQPLTADAIGEDGEIEAHSHSVESLVEDPVLLASVSRQCVKGAQYRGIAKGWNVTIAGIPTYYSKPPFNWFKPWGTPDKVILFYSDVYSVFSPNNFMLMDWYASKGYHVIGLDYFFGQPAQNFNLTDPVEIENWVTAQKVHVPVNAELRPTLHPARNTKFVSVGYCFGAPYSIEAAATNSVLAGALAQPAFLTESHFYNVQKPFMLSLAEIDMTFPTEARNRAMDILAAEKKVHFAQIFGGTEHGFATRADLTDPGAAWAKETSANSILDWFNRFTK